MHVIRTRNVNQALSEALHWLKVAGKQEDSRNGPVLVAPGPVATVYSHPKERVLFSRMRDANPFFHLMESLWMLAGRNDVAFLSQFNSRISSYSDDGVKFWGAYGHRWRKWFAHDQLSLIIEDLRKNRASRRNVLAMWDGYTDLQQAAAGGKDIPCNLLALFDCRGDVLNMTVMNRSNDAIWGCYGANVVHFSVLQEYVACCVGLPVGIYTQFSNNLHVYTERPDYKALVPNVDVRDCYQAGVDTFSLMSTDRKVWDTECSMFCDNPTGDFTYSDPFFEMVARPMARSWFARKNGISDGLLQAHQIAATDWRTACVEWIERKEAKRASS